MALFHTTKWQMIDLSHQVQADQVEELAEAQVVEVL
jgi:hypothetical protein